MNRLKMFTTAILAGILFFPLAADAQKQTGIVAHRGFWNCEEAAIYAGRAITALSALAAKDYGNL